MPKPKSGSEGLTEAAAKPRAARAARAKSAPAKAKAGKAAFKPAGRTGAAPAGDGDLRKKDLVDRVVAASGVKPGEAKKSVEALLDILAGELAGGRALTLPPLGKLSVVKRKATGNGEVLTLKLRRGGGQKTAKEPLAATEE